VLAHRGNETFRILTAFSVIMLPLTLVASIWGMNVHVPGQGDPTAFYLVLGLMLVVLVSLVTYFRKRGFL
jgi:magnesium transporter